MPFLAVPKPGVLRRALCLSATAFRLTRVAAQYGCWGRCCRRACCVREIWRACGFWRQVTAHICLRPCQNGGALLLRSVTVCSNSTNQSQQMKQMTGQRESGNFDKSCVIESRQRLGLSGPLHNISVRCTSAPHLDTSSPLPHDSRLVVQADLKGALAPRHFVAVELLDGGVRGAAPRNAGGSWNCRSSSRRACIAPS